jgi:hypothetical protein
MNIMKIELNTDKQSFCTIGTYSFTWGQTTHDVDIDALTPELRKQFLYNLKRGVLTSEGKAIEELSEAEAQPASVEIPVKVPRAPQPIMSDTERLKEDLKSLRSLLNLNISSIKAEAINFRVARLRKLLELERTGKNRKGLVAFLDDILEDHNSTVLEVIGDNDVIGQHSEDPIAASTQVTDIVESDEEELTLSLEVLNQLGD